MDADMNAFGGIFVGPVRRRLSPDDEFFDLGNVQSYRALKSKMSVFALACGSEEMGWNDDLHLHERSYECMFEGCIAKFSSLSRYESHYETSHRNRCGECGRSFPTNRLLDMHLSEAHDSFFAALADRRPMYKCLVEGCQDAFQSSGKRKTHLVKFHRYPKSFDFSRPSYIRNTRPRRGKTVGDAPDDDGAEIRNNAGNQKSKCKARMTGKKQEGEEKNPPPADQKPSNIVAMTKMRPRATKLKDLVIESASGSVDHRCKLVGVEHRHEMDVETQKVATQRQKALNTANPEPSRLHTPPVAASRIYTGMLNDKGCSSPSFSLASGAITGDLDVDTPVATNASGGGIVSGLAIAGGPDVAPCNGGIDSGAATVGMSGISMDLAGDEDAPMDDLVDGMKKLLVPSKLSFGRSARRGNPRGGVRC